MSHRRSRLIVAAAALVAFASFGGAQAASTELFISEYIEGSSHNKALDIYNGTGAPVVFLHGNGAMVDDMLISGLVDLRTKVILSLSGLQQSNGLTEIPLKSQLGDLDCQGPTRRGLCVYRHQQFSGFLQVTLSLIHAGIPRAKIRVIGKQIQRSIVEL